MNHFEKHVIDVVNYHREMRGISIHELAKRTDIAENCLGKTLRHKRNLTLCEALKIALYLDIAFKEIFDLNLLLTSLPSNSRKEIQDRFKKNGW